MKIFGMGGLEIVIILVVILIIFGPKNLPKLGNAIGKTVSNLREGMNAGKKKKVEEGEGEKADAEPAASDEGQSSAAIAGEVDKGEAPEESEDEFVEFEDEPAEDGEEFEESEESVEDSADEPEAAAAEEAEEEPAENSAEEPAKKVVRRVVKKKVKVVEPAEAE